MEKELSAGNINPKLFANKSKEYSNLGNIINIAKSYIKFEQDKKDLENLIKDKLNDAEIVELAQNDLNDLIKQREKWENELFTKKTSMKSIVKKMKGARTSLCRSI